MVLARLVPVTCGAILLAAVSSGAEELTALAPHPDEEEDAAVRPQLDADAGPLAPPEDGGGTSPAPVAVVLDLLTFYRDNYIITGFTDSTEVKLQLSAKFDLWPNRSRHAFHFGFTGKALWNVYKPSSPFLESNYNPEVFYTFFHHDDRGRPPLGCAFFHERLGFEHESNGEGGATSRSWNRFYIESRFSCYAAAGHFATASLQVWAPPIGIGDNPDIVNYLGYGELGLSIGSEGKRSRWSEADLTATFRKGTARSISVGGIEVDARWRPPYADFWRFTPYLYAQLFAGYGETLLSYDRPTTSFRVGLGLADVSARSK